MCMYTYTEAWVTYANLTSIENRRENRPFVKPGGDLILILYLVYHHTLQIRQYLLYYILDINHKLLSCIHMHVTHLMYREDFLIVI